MSHNWPKRTIEQTVIIRPISLSPLAYYPVILLHLSAFPWKRGFILEDFRTRSTLWLVCSEDRLL